MRTACSAVLAQRIGHRVERPHQFARQLGGIERKRIGSQHVAPRRVQCTTVLTRAAWAAAERRIDGLQVGQRGALAQRVGRGTRQHERSNREQRPRQDVDGLSHAVALVGDGRRGWPGAVRVAQV
jgi:hypothetical protein